MNGSDHGRLGQAINHAFIHRRHGREPQRMAIETSFAEKMTGSQDCNYCFLALLGNDGEFELAFLDVKNGVRHVSLRENNLVLAIFEYRFALADFGEEFLGIERGLGAGAHKESLSSDEGRAKSGFGR